MIAKTKRGEGGGARSPRPPLNSPLTHVTNLVDLVINDICYEYSQGGVCLNSFDSLFVDKDVRCTSKTEIKDWLQSINKKLSLPGEIYT